MALVPNVPTEEGRALGKEMARLCDGELLDKKDDRCATCAFRAGTDPNGCAPTLMDAIKCAIEGVPFLCHEHEGRACAGWATMAAGRNADRGHVPWPFSDEAADERA